MNKIRISDVTMKQTGANFSLSFREKIEMSKLSRAPIGAVTLMDVGESHLAR